MRHYDPANAGHAEIVGRANAGEAPKAIDAALLLTANTANQVIAAARAAGVAVRGSGPAGALRRNRDDFYRRRRAEILARREAGERPSVIAASLELEANVVNLILYRAVAAGATFVPVGRGRPARDEVAARAAAVHPPASLPPGDRPLSTPAEQLARGVKLTAVAARFRLPYQEVIAIADRLWGDAVPRLAAERYRSPPWRERRPAPENPHG